MRLLTLIFILISFTCGAQVNTTVKSLKIANSDSTHGEVNNTEYVNSAGKYRYKENGTWKYRASTSMLNFWPLSGTKNLSGDVTIQGVSGAHALTINSLSSLVLNTNTSIEIGLNPTTAYILGVSGEEFSVTNDQFLFTGGKVRLTPSATLSGLNIGSRTSDPSSLTNFDIWGRSDLNKIRARINGVTQNIATESYVGSSFWPLSGNGSVAGDVYIFPAVDNTQTITIGQNAAASQSVSDLNLKAVANINVGTVSGDITISSANDFTIATQNAVSIYSSNSISGVGIAANSGPVILTADSAVQLNSNTGAFLLVGTLNGEIQLKAGGSRSIKLTTGLTERLEIENDGAWQVNSSTGSSGQYLKSNGASSTPTWASVFTNSAAADEIIKSDGTNGVPTGLFSSAAGTITMGSASIAGDRSIFASNTASNANLTLQAQAGVSAVAATSFSASAGTGTVQFVTNSTARFTIENDGSWNINSSNGTSGQVLTSNGSASTPTWQTLPVYSSGSYTPTVSSTGGVVTATTPSETFYLRIGSIVQVTGFVSVTTSGAGLASFHINLPVASDFTNQAKAPGLTITYGGGVSRGYGQVESDATANDVLIYYEALGATSDAVKFSFMYIIQ